MPTTCSSTRSKEAERSEGSEGQQVPSSMPFTPLPSVHQLQVQSLARGLQSQAKRGVHL